MRQLGSILFMRGQNTQTRSGLCSLVPSRRQPIQPIRRPQDELARAPRSRRRRGARRRSRPPRASTPSSAQHRSRVSDERHAAVRSRRARTAPTARATRSSCAASPTGGGPTTNDGEPARRGVVDDPVQRPDASPGATRRRPSSTVVSLAPNAEDDAVARGWRVRVRASSRRASARRRQPTCRGARRGCRPSAACPARATPRRRARPSPGRSGRRRRRRTSRRRRGRGGRESSPGRCSRRVRAAAVREDQRHDFADHAPARHRRAAPAARASPGGRRLPRRSRAVRVAPRRARRRSTRSSSSSASPASCRRASAARR